MNVSVLFDQIKKACLVILLIIYSLHFPALNHAFVYYEHKMDDAQAKFEEAIGELQAAWEQAIDLAGNPADLAADRDDLEAELDFKIKAEEELREKIEEKMAERDEIMGKIEQWEEIKPELEEVCERLGIENENLKAFRDKVQEE